MVDYSIVVPVYNSENTLDELFRRIKQTFHSMGKSFEVIFVDDFSEDKSWKKLKELKRENPQEIKAIKLSKNFGQHSAILCGLNFVENSVITLDDDLQIPPEEIPKLIETLNESDADVVYGIFEQKKHSFFRNIGHHLIERIFKEFANTSGKGSSFKLIDFSIVEKIRIQNQQFIYIDEILSWFTNNIDYVTVKHLPREGTSSYSTAKLFLMTFNLLINYTVFPLRMMTYFGLFVSIISACFGLYFLFMKLLFGAEIGFTALIVAIFFSTSLVMFCMGIIGEYISRLYINQSNRPTFLIKTVI